MEQKNYNPNTKYGRRKTREALQTKINNMTPEQRTGYDSEMNMLLFILLCFTVQ